MPSFGMRVFFVVEYVICVCVRSPAENLKFRKSDTNAVRMRRLANRNPMHCRGPENDETVQCITGIQQ